MINFMTVLQIKTFVAKLSTTERSRPAPVCWFGFLACVRIAWERIYCTSRGSTPYLSKTLCQLSVRTYTSNTCSRSSIGGIRTDKTQYLYLVWSKECMYGVSGYGTCMYVTVYD